MPGLSDFVHRYDPPEAGERRTLLLLHGTGGNEHDLVPLGQLLAPARGRLSPRGRVLERGMPRFFRRFAEGVFDLDDVRRQAGALAGFVEAASAHYAFDAGGVTAVGYSNGANIAAAMLLLHPTVLAGAVLFHPQVTIVPEALPDLANRPVLVTAGRRDPIVPVEETARLVEVLQGCGALVDVSWHDGGHGLVQSEVDAARAWLGGRSAAGP